MELEFLAKERLKKMTFLRMKNLVFLSIQIVIQWCVRTRFMRMKRVEFGLRAKGHLKKMTFLRMKSAVFL